MSGPTSARIATAESCPRPGIVCNRLIRCSSPRESTRLSRIRSEVDDEYPAARTRVKRVRIARHQGQETNVKVRQTVVELAPVGAAVDASEDAVADSSRVEHVG